MQSCGITFDKLMDYRDERADENTSALIRSHLDTGCSHCVDGLAWLQGATQTIYEAQQVQVPQILLDRASALFRERFRPPARVSWLARLQFDSRSSSLALAGARGAKREGVQLVYTTDQHDIELFQEPTDQGTWYIIGQVMPKVGDATLIPQEIILTRTDSSDIIFTPESEEFHLPSLQAGIYGMTLRLAEGDIALSNVAIGQ